MGPVIYVLILALAYFVYLTVVNFIKYQRGWGVHLVGGPSIHPSSLQLKWIKPGKANRAQKRLLKLEILAGLAMIISIIAILLWY